MIMTFLSVTGKRSPRQRSPLPTSIWPCLFVVAVFLSASAFVGFSPRKFVVSLGQPPTSDICPQEAALFPARNAPIWEATHEETASNAFKTRAIDWLAGAVQIPTESYDNMQPIGVDPRWLVFADFHAYLTRAFPLVHANLRLQKINTYGLLYEWTGSDDTLKPVLLAAHQDVVPVDPSTVRDWTYPPYSRHFDGKRIWGRGSADDKNGLCASMYANYATSDAALRALEGILSKDRLYRSQIGTTQAVDVVSGGVKSNALPEEARAVVNHRVHLDSSLAAVRAHDTALLQPLASRFNLTYTAFGVNVSEPGAPASGALTLGEMYALEPAPVTPTSGSEAAPYQLLAGSIRAAYETRTRRAATDSEDNDDDDPVVVAPSIMSGNTDTRYYWNLSRHIFRYGHGNSAGVGPDEMLNGIHTVDESVDADDFVEIIRFFATLILNADESTVL